MGNIEKQRFERRGARGCSNSDYELRRTTCCGAFCAEDEELSDLYVDPNDLSKVVRLLAQRGDPIVCPFCGARDWRLRAEPASAAPDAWRWAVVSP